MDCHGAGKGWTFNSLIPDQLDPRCDFVVQQEWTEYTEFLEQGCDAALFVGMHAMAGTPDGVLNHTVSGTGWRSLAFNGTLVGETGINAALCGTWGCPVLLVTGRRGLLPRGDGVARRRPDDGRGQAGPGPLQRAPHRAGQGARADRAGRSRGARGPHGGAALRPGLALRDQGRARRPATRSSATATTQWSRSSTAARWSRGLTTGGRPGASSTSRSSARSSCASAQPPARPPRTRRSWSRPRARGGARPPTSRPARRPRCGASAASRAPRARCCRSQRRATSSPKRIVSVPRVTK